MSTWTRDTAAGTAVETVPDEVDPLYQRNGWARVVPAEDPEAVRARLEAEVGALKGEQLAEAARQAGVPVKASADDKRAGILAARRAELEGTSAEAATSTELLVLTPAAADTQTGTAGTVPLVDSVATTSSATAATAEGDTTTSAPAGAELGTTQE